MADLTFLGAARTVTGSKYLLSADGHRILVDAGLFQGLKALRERNWARLPVDPATLDAVVLTHAHLDHCGYLPRLVAQGFTGRIYCTPGTLDLCRIVLPDAGRIQEEDAERANRYGYTRHQPALPLFSEAEAFRALLQLQPVGFDREIPVAPGITVTFSQAGHLLGSAFATVRLANGGNPLTVLFGGDLGRYDRPVLPDPSPAPAADFLLVESTYGDRAHPRNDDGEALARIVKDTVGRGGKVIVPAFAIGRVEEILYWLKRLEDERRIPVLPVYLDSPMALTALGYYEARSSELDPEMREREAGRKALSAFATRRYSAAHSTQQSKEVTRSKAPAIVISSSGMATGGRVLHHLKAALPDPKHTVLFVGFQAEGTRGRLLLDGAKTIKIHGEDVPVAARIEQIDSMSAHADAEEILRWLRTLERPPRRTFLVHGEPAAMDALRGRIEAELGWSVHAPELGESVTLDP